MPESVVATFPSEAQSDVRLPIRVVRLVVHRAAGIGRDRVEVHASDGSVGYGEGDWGEAALRVAPELLIGRSPFAVESIFEAVTARAGKTPGGLDIALWDVCARSLGTPLCSLVGKTYRREVRVCVAGGEKRLCVEGVEFIEEPLPVTDVAGYRRLREQAGPLVAAGRTFAPDVLIRDFLQTRLIDLALPEIGSCGLTGLRRLSYYCWIFHVRLAARCSGSPVSLAAALHAAACFVPVSRAIAAPPGFVVTPQSCGADRLPVPDEGAGLGIVPEPARERPYLEMGD